MLSGAPATKSRNRRIYEAHVANERAMLHAIVVVERLAKDAVRTGHPQDAVVLRHNLHVLSGAWAECVLRRLLYTRGLLNDDRRRTVLYTNKGLRGQDARWTEIVNQALFTRYRVSKYSDLRPVPQSWSHDLGRYLRDYVDPLIVDRNDRAHGGWAASLDLDKPKLPDVDEPVFIATAEPDDYLLLRRRRTMVRTVADAVEDLVAVPHTAQGEIRLHALMTVHFSSLAGAAQNITRYDREATSRALLARPRRTGR